MVGALRVGTATAQPGEVARGYIPYGLDAMRRPMGIPVVVINGATDGPRLWINAGTHGDEAEGALAVFALLKDVSAHDLRGAIVAVPMLNPAAFIAGTRGDPLDTFSYDLNRIYPGRADGYATERLAAAHWEAMQSACDLQISIHSGGDHSFLSHMVFASESGRELAAALGPDWGLVFGSATGSGNPSSQLAAEGIPAVTVELGGLCRTLTHEFTDVAAEYVRSILNVLRHYQMLPGAADYASSWSIGHQIALLAPASGLFVGDGAVRFELPTREGVLLGTIQDCFGDVVAEIRAPQDGVVFGLRSRPHVRAGEWCCFFGAIEETVSDLIPADRRAE
jgi:predicted deacylase